MPSQKPQSHAPIAATLAAVVLSWGLAFGGAYVADAVWGVDAWDHHVPVSAVIVLASVVSLAVVCLWRRSALASASLAMLGWFPLLLLNCFWVLGDAVLDALAPFHKLRYLDVVDTGVTTEGMQRFTAARPSLRFHPRPRKA